MALGILDFKGRLNSGLTELVLFISGNPYQFLFKFFQMSGNLFRHRHRLHQLKLFLMYFER